MTSEDHNKVICIMHLIYGGMTAIMLPFVLIFVFLGAGMSSLDPSAPPEVGFLLVFMGLLFGLIFLLFGLPQLIAGYGMLKRKSWARTWGLVAGILSAVSFPLGTALCVYTLWFLFGEGKGFYEGMPTAANWRGSLHQGSTYGWEAQTGARTRQHEYAPPPQPPNWREE